MLNVAGKYPVLLLLGLFLLFFSHEPAMGSEGFSGVGVQAVPIATGELVVLRVLAGSPAEKADLRPGDLIVQVDDFPLAGSDFEDVVHDRLWGRIGTSLVIHYLRPGVEGSASVRVVRSEVKGPVEQTPGVRLLKPR